MKPFTNLYVRNRLVHINVNAIIAGIASLLISANFVYLTYGMTDNPLAIVLFSYVIDGIVDFLVFAGLHVMLYHARFKFWSFSHKLAKDLIALQSQRLVFTIVTFIVAVGSHLALMELGFGRTRAFIIAYALALLATRTTHTLYGLKRGLFRPLVFNRERKSWQLFSPLQQARSIIAITLGIALVFIGIALLVLPGPGIITIFVGLTLLAGHFWWARRLVHRLKRDMNSTKKNIAKLYKASS